MKCFSCWETQSTSCDKRRILKIGNNFCPQLIPRASSLSRTWLSTGLLSEMIKKFGIEYVFSCEFHYPIDSYNISVPFICTWWSLLNIYHLYIVKGNWNKPISLHFLLTLSPCVKEKLMWEITPSNRVFSLKIKHIYYYFNWHCFSVAKKYLIIIFQNFDELLTRSYNLKSFHNKIIMIYYL